MKDSNYALMTFHSATNSNENICETMKFSINRIISSNYKILITYPNNDLGSKDIIDLINTYKYDKNIVIVVLVILLERDRSYRRVSNIVVLKK